MADLAKTVRRFLGSTPRRTFVLYPALVAGFEVLRRRRLTIPHPQFLPLLIWGYLQYRLTGEYRRRQRAGPPGYASLPDRLLQTGPYAYTRNPMYLGHLIFLLGLALSLRSIVGWLLLLTHLPWYQHRVLKDEARLREKFGREYEEYTRRVKRWIPFIL